MRLSKAIREKEMDVRLRDKLIAEAKLTPDMVKKYVDSLGDEQANVAYAKIVEEKKVPAEDAQSSEN